MNTDITNKTIKIGDKELYPPFDFFSIKQNKDEYFISTYYGYKVEVIPKFYNVFLNLKNIPVIIKGEKIEYCIGNFLKHPKNILDLEIVDMNKPEDEASYGYHLQQARDFIVKEKYGILAQDVKYYPPFEIEKSIKNPTVPISSSFPITIPISSSFPITIELNKDFYNAIKGIQNLIIPFITLNNRLLLGELYFNPTHIIPSAKIYEPTNEEEWDLILETTEEQLIKKAMMKTKEDENTNLEGINKYLDRKDFAFINNAIYTGDNNIYNDGNIDSILYKVLMRRNLDNLLFRYENLILGKTHEIIYGEQNILRSLIDELICNNE